MGNIRLSTSYLTLLKQKYLCKLLYEKDPSRSDDPSKIIATWLVLDISKDSYKNSVNDYSGLMYCIDSNHLGNIRSNLSCSISDIENYLKQGTLRFSKKLKE